MKYISINFTKFFCIIIKNWWIFPKLLYSFFISENLTQKHYQGESFHRSNKEKKKIITNFKNTFFKYLFIYLFLFIYFWLRCVFVAVRGLSLVVASGGYSSLRCAGFSLWWLLLLQSTGLVAPRHVGSAQTRARTRVPCIGRRILNHCTTREVPKNTLLNVFLKYIHKYYNRL